MAIELVLDASVSLAWFLKEAPDRAAYAAAVNAAAADGAVLHVPVQWGIEVGHVLLREYRRKAFRRTKLRQALEDLESFDIRTHLELYSARQVVDLAERYHLQGYDALYLHLARVLRLPLATLDDGHRHAAPLHGVTLFTPSDGGTGRV
jgi:predicted nucleic acid-binding protein